MREQIRSLALRVQNNSQNSNTNELETLGKICHFSDSQQNQNENNQGIGEREISNTARENVIW